MSTPIYGFPFGTLSMSPNGAAQTQALAEAVETKVAAVDAEVDALQATQTVSDIQNTSGTTTSASFTSTLTGGTACGVAFTAPLSGAVIIHHTIEASNSGAGFSHASIRVKTGAVVGSGTDVVADSFDEGITVTGTNGMTGSRIRHLTGLTPGASYNVQERFRVNTGTGTFLRKSIVVTRA